MTTNRKSSRRTEAGPVSLPKMLFEKDLARGSESDLAAGNPFELSFINRPDSANSGPSADPERITLPYDIASLDVGDAELAQAVPEMVPDIGRIMEDPASGHVTYSRIWPVPGHGEPARRGAVGPNGHGYSDGRYSPAGTYRKSSKGKPLPHYGLDLPAAIGTDVVAADSGVVRSATDGAGWGSYVALDHGDGTVGLYAHLSPDGRPGVGTHVQQGQKIGSVGGTGNAANRGDHLHYEVRRDLGGRTLARPSSGGVTIDPTEWMRKRVSR